MLSAGVEQSGFNPHARLDRGVACAHPPPIPEFHPAVLTSTHKAESRPDTVAEFKPTHCGLVEQDGGDREIACLDLDRPAINGNLEAKTSTINQAVKLCRALAHQLAGAPDRLQALD